MPSTDTPIPAQLTVVAWPDPVSTFWTSSPTTPTASCCRRLFREVCRVADGLPHRAEGLFDSGRLLLAPDGRTHDAQNATPRARDVRKHCPVVSDERARHPPHVAWSRESRAPRLKAASAGACLQAGNRPLAVAFECGLWVADR